MFRKKPEGYCEDGKIANQTLSRYTVIITPIITTQTVFQVEAITKEDAVAKIRMKINNKEIHPKLHFDVDTL